MFYTIFDVNKNIMKNKNNFKKLVLNKETVTVLNETQQRMLIGGGTETDPGNTTTSTNCQTTIVVTTLRTGSGSKTKQN